MNLYIAGAIQDNHYFNRRVALYIDNQQVFYLGSLGPDKRDELMGGALALLHPIHFKEPFGLSVIESIACGTPVIAFNRGSMPEVVKHGYSGYLVQNVEEACQAIKEVKRLSRQECRRWVEEHFSQERMVNDYLAVYEQVLREKDGEGSQVAAFS